MALTLLKMVSRIMSLTRDKLVSLLGVDDVHTGLFHRGIGSECLQLAVDMA